MPTSVTNLHNPSSLPRYSHPTGFFLRGDASQLEGIIRKIRSRPEKGKRAGNRRVSVASASSIDGMDDYAPSSHSVPLALPPVHQSGWQAPDFRPQYAEDRRPLTTFLPSFQSPFAHYTPTASTSSSSNSGPPPRHADITTWRAYTPATSTWQPASSSNSSAPYDRYSNRRSSIPDFKFAPSMTLSSTKEETVVEERPRLRKAASSLCIQTTNHHTNHGETGFRQSPYPTPTISPAYNSYFPSSNPQVPIAAECSPQSQPSGLPYTPYIPPHHQHQQQVAPRHHQQHQQLQQHRGSSHPALPSPTSSDPSPHSPPHAEYVPLGLDPRQLVHPVSPRNPHQDYYEQPQQAETYFNDNPPPMALGGGGWQQAQVTGA